ncbi:MAG: NADPH-dependent FMN reductase [Myxococcales bacterium]
MTILGISGSLRITSSNMAILRAAARLAPSATHVEIYDRLAEVPAFSPDLDVDPLPEPIVDLRARIARADALLISSPEYAHGMPGSLKNLLDWLVSALEALHKPVLVLSASPGGAVFAHAQLLEVLRTMNLCVVDGGAHVFSRSKLDPMGEVASRELLSTIAAALVTLAATATAAQQRQQHET